MLIVLEDKVINQMIIQQNTHGFIYYTAKYVKLLLLICKYKWISLKNILRQCLEFVCFIYTRVW